MKKLNLLILPLFFFGFIYFMFLNQIVGWKIYRTDSENRALSKMPKFEMNDLETYPQEFDAYLNDNYSFRGLFLEGYHEAKFQMRISPNIENVIIGSNGIFFAADPDQQIFNGERSFDKAAIARFKEIWKEKNAYLANKNIPFVWLIAPDKHHVYTEDLPIWCYEKKKNRTIVLKESLERNFPNQIIYPVDALREHREFAYFKNDTHWSHKGAYFAYLELLKTLKKEDRSIKYMDINNIHWNYVKQTTGNLLNFLGKEGEISETVCEARILKSVVKEAPLLNIRTIKDFAAPEWYQLHFTNKKALNKKRVLIIRDSFGDKIMPYLNESFSETLYIFDGWHYAVNKEIIEKYKPELVIFLTLETNLDGILKYNQIIEHE